MVLKIIGKKLEKLISKNITPPTMEQSNGLVGVPDLKIYVPDASLNDYKTATNWVAYADKIFPLSELEG